MSSSITELETVIHDSSENEDYVSLRFNTGGNYVNLRMSSKSKFNRLTSETILENTKRSR